jgi:hypothetical protein
MGRIGLSCVLAFAFCAPSAFAQQAETPWEAGVAGGFGWHSSKDIAARGASANAGIGGAIAVSGYVGHNMYRLVSGEIRYTLQIHDLKVSAGGEKASFNAQSHALHYDFLIHRAPVEAKVRPFVAFGGGIKSVRGTGKEMPFQPLSQFAILTHTNQWLGMGSLAGGAKWKIGERTLFRAEVRYYISRFPDQVIAPSSGDRLKGWMHNIVPMAGISYTF